MDLKETRTLNGAIESHWYYRSKAQAMTRLLGGIVPIGILDVGAGSGFFSRYLLTHTAAKEAWCVDVNYNVDSEGNENGKTIHYRRSIEAINANLVLFMDVLEHVDDDIALLRDYRNKVPRGSSFLISVPAFEFLWSGHDQFLEHKRRYQLAQIEDVVERAGLTVKHGAYYFGVVFPIAAIIRIFQNLFHKGVHQLRSQLKQHHPVVNEALAALSYVELPMMKHNRFAGLTAFCLAESS